MRKLALALLTLVIAGLVSAKAGVAFFDGFGAVAEENGAVAPRLLGIHQLSLADGVKPEDFERFIVEEWNPIMSGLWPGIHLMVMKGERNADQGDYLLTYDIQSVDVRDWYFPGSGEPSEASTAIWEKCGDVCNEVSEKFDQMAEVTDWTDYVALARD